MLLSPPPPPPPPPSPPLPPSLFPLQDTSSVAGAGGHHHYSYNPSILIIAAIIASAIIAAASIHLLLRSISRSRSPPLIYHTSSSSSPSTSSRLSPPSDQDPKALIDSLPLFSLSSTSTSTSKFSHPPSSLYCAVCLSPFTFSDELRLLPACRHAFHSQCIDTWLKSNLSCPLCRSPISPNPPPPPPPPQPETARSDSFRVEIGSVSRRTDDDSTRAPHVRSRSYSLGSSFEYVVEDEIEAVISRIRRKPDLEEAGAAPPRSPAAEVAELVGGSQRSWLKEYVDRLASSASSSFSSLRFSQRGSNRFDSGGDGSGGGGDGWDLERNLQLHLEEGGDDVEGILSTFYRWFVGV